MDFGRLAVGFGLLVMPKMPELSRSGSKVKTDFFTPMEGVDLNSIAYRDKTRERLRQEKLSAYRATGVWPSSSRQTAAASAGGGGSAPNRKKEAWSEQKEQKMRRKEKRLVKMEQKEKRNIKKRRAAEAEAAAFDEEEWQELARDARLLKKLKRRKVMILNRSPWQRPSPNERND